MKRPSLEERSGYIGRDAEVSHEAKTQSLVEPPSKRVAVFVAHGMGQQVPFETMDVVAEGIRQAAMRKGHTITAISGVTALLNDVKVQRVEMEVAAGEDASVNIHVYEGYWAPLTEGQVGIIDVISFLFRGGVNGIANALNPFQRWMFGDIVSFGKRHVTAFWLTLALAIVMSLILFNAVIPLGLSGDWSVSLGASGDQKAISPAIATIIGTWALYTIVVGAYIYVLSLLRKPGKSNVQSLLPHAGVVLLIVWVVATLGAAVLILATFFRWVQLDWLESTFFNGYWVWPALLLISWGIRTILVQFPGDVAAYISSHVLDRFSELRSKVKKAVLETAKAIYASGEYEHVIIVGHSLGSVVVYDVLNTLLTDDELAQNSASRRSLDVLKRTKLLLTFGSPLDKTAFIFATQWAKTTATREATAASFQPLIQSYEPFRRIPWINVYSPYDIISGSLEFYDSKDDPLYSALKVQNVCDDKATTPLLAHVEYWANECIFDHLYQSCVK